jgi:pimeloyl-ACP methyl ester carboxylesterase
MAPIARELSDRYRIFEPLQRRSGDLPLTVDRHINDLREVIDACCPVERPGLVGSSWGAMLALAFGAAYPDVVGPLVLVGSGTYTVESSAEFHRLLDERITPEQSARLDAAASADDPDTALAEAAAELDTPYSYNIAGTPSDLEWVDARGNRETNDDWNRRRAGGEFPGSSAPIQQPVLMIHGVVDPHPGLMIRDSLLPVLPRLEYVEVERCGHYPWRERYARDQFYEILFDWLAKHLPLTPPA